MDIKALLNDTFSFSEKQIVWAKQQIDASFEEETNIAALLNVIGWSHWKVVLVALHFMITIDKTIVGLSPYHDNAPEFDKHILCKLSHLTSKPTSTKNIA